MKNALMEDKYIKNKKPVESRLISYGFLKNDGFYTYTAELCTLGMRLDIRLENRSISTKMTDMASGEEYILHRTDACGSFVGRVRTEYESILADIAQKCFDKEIFCAPQTKRVIEYIGAKYGTELEFLWDSSPNSAVARHSGTKKWYGVIMTIPKNRLGFDSNEPVEVINLHIKSDKIASVTDGICIFPGWHMNKKHWITVILDGRLPDDVLFERIDESYKRGEV